MFHGCGFRFLTTTLPPPVAYLFFLISLSPHLIQISNHWLRRYSYTKSFAVSDQFCSCQTNDAISCHKSIVLRIITPRTELAPPTIYENNLDSHMIFIAINHFYFGDTSNFAMIILIRSKLGHFAFILLLFRTVFIVSIFYFRFYSSCNSILVYVNDTIKCTFWHFYIDIYSSIIS